MTEPWQRSAVELAALLAKREVSSVEVVRAHLDRIAARDARVHAFTEVFRDRALDEARRRDDERARGEVRGPLHGLPVSVKESLDHAGSASTLGLAKRRDVRATRDAVVVRAVRDAGGIVLGRTNVAQTLMMSESRNPLFGQTVNPHRETHAAGGSSGGEAAAIASGMSCLGVGTDIGGSIRAPAHFCGIAALKPTLDRWSNRGSNGIFRGQEMLRSQCGPMARTAADVAMLATALDPAAMSALDPLVAPLAWQDPAALDVTRLRVGVYVADGLVTPSRAIVRAVERAAKALRDAGVDVVPFSVPRVPEMFYAFFTAVSGDGGATFLRALDGEEIDPVLAPLASLSRLPGAVRAAIVRGMRLRGQGRLAGIAAHGRRRDVAAFWAETWQLRAWRLEVMDAMADARVDALLGHPYATPAMPHGLSRHFAVAISGTAVFNLLQFPAGVVPVTRVRSDELERAPGRDRLDARAAEIDRASDGLPVGVHVAAPPYRDERVLALMLAIERAVRSDEGFPRTPV